MDTELNEYESITLSRLRRCARWVETGRGAGFVTLEGVRGNKLETFSFQEHALNGLLSAGLVECEESPRLYDPGQFLYESRRGIRKQTQTYWRASLPLPDDESITGDD